MKNEIAEKECQTFWTNYETITFGNITTNLAGWINSIYDL